MSKIQIMIAGAAKCGTSALSDWTFACPSVEGHVGVLEFNFFSNDDEYRRGMDWAISHYYRGKTKIGNVLAAKSVDLMYDRMAINRLYEHNPDCVIVVMLRNPIDRAYSAYWFARRRGWESADTFESALDLQNGPPASKLSIAQRSRQYVERGHYAPYISTLIEKFGRDRVLVYLSEDMKSHSAEIFAEIHRVAGLPSMDYEPPVPERRNAAAAARSVWLASMLTRRIPVPRLLRTPRIMACAKRVKSKIRKMNEASFTPPVMCGSTRARLAAIFTPMNVELGTVLGRDFSAWK